MPTQPTTRPGPKGAGPLDSRLLKAARELVERSTREQGLPIAITDPVALTALAAMFITKPIAVKAA
jgi:hypothetical protein